MCGLEITKYDLHPAVPKAVFPNLRGLHQTAAFPNVGSSPVGDITFQTTQITEVGTAGCPRGCCVREGGGLGLSWWRKGLQASEFLADLIDFAGTQC